MPLTTADRHNLTGPAVVGAVFGMLCAAAIAAVHSEYGDHMEPLYPGVRGVVGQMLLTFLIVTTAVVVIFGVTPILLKRLLSRPPRGPAA